MTVTGTVSDMLMVCAWARDASMLSTDVDDATGVVRLETQSDGATVGWVTDTEAMILSNDVGEATEAVEPLT